MMMTDDDFDIVETGDRGAAWKRGLASVAALMAGLLLITLVYLLAHSNGTRDRALAHQRHSYDVLIVTRGLDAAMARSEASLGRFVISGDKRTGTLYYDDWSLAGRMLFRLAQLTTDDPVQSTLVRDLKDVYEQRGKELADPATRANYHQGWAALAKFNDAGKSKAIPQMARILSQIEANEQMKLDFRSDRATEGTEWSNQLSSWVSVLGILIACAGGFVAWLALQAFRQRRVAARAALAENERAVVLEYAIAERTRELREANEQLRQEAATRAEAEAQLRQVQKMEAVGQLTGGIAHDFNNMLAVVVGGLDLARRRLTNESEEIARHIDNAMEGATRAAALTRRLLSFARSEPLRSQEMSPSKLITGMTELVDRTLGERIKVVIEGLDQGLAIWADPHQFENAIVNLAVNARDAMDSDGTLTIRIERKVLQDREVNSLSAGDYVAVAVSDTGCGMTAEQIDRAFEPFFTTKPVGKGTGLGLSQVFGFARQSGGDVTIVSRLGEGTTVTLYIPRLPTADIAVTEAPQPISLVAPAPLQPKASVATILIVEDDPRVRIATVGALEELGHHTIACGSGEAALAELQHRHDIDLLITDVIMPSMTGPELVSQVVKLYPHIGVLFVTGFAGGAGGVESFAEHDVLRKPFTVAGLSTAVEAALQKVSGRRHGPTSAAAE